MFCRVCIDFVCQNQRRDYVYFFGNDPNAMRKIIKQACTTPTKL